MLGSLRDIMQLHANITLLRYVLYIHVFNRCIYRPCRSVQLLHNLSQEELERIARMLTKVVVNGETIITQGEEGDRFYMIEKGEVSVEIDGVQVSNLAAGAHFGEMGLMNNDRRNATVVAIGEVELWTLSRDDFNQLMGMYDE